jgi:hypothetical protein
MKKCNVCLSEFTPKNSKGNYCTNKCKQVDYRRRVAKLLLDARRVSVDKPTLTPDTISPIKEILINSKESQIADLELEMSKLGTGTYANSYKKVLEKKIYNLKYQ